MALGLMGWQPSGSEKAHLAGCSGGCIYSSCNLEDIREVHHRVAEVKNLDINIQNYTPPQFFQCFMYLNRECAEYRRKILTGKPKLDLIKRIWKL